jgi:hypothetical protein
MSFVHSSVLLACCSILLLWVRIIRLEIIRLVSDTDCRTLQPTEAEYRQRHVTLKCSFPLVDLEQRQLTTLILTGHVPGLTFSDESGLSMRLISHRGDQEPESYVADV